MALASQAKARTSSETYVNLQEKFFKASMIKVFVSWLPLTSSSAGCCKVDSLRWCAAGSPEGSSYLAARYWLEFSVLRILQQGAARHAQGMWLCKRNGKEM